MADPNWGDIYKEIGAQPIINAIGSVTMLGGSLPAPEVKQAMDRADAAYIPLIELEEKAGRAVANMVNVPAAYVTSGAGSALTLATAAIMAGEDDEKIQQLKDEIFYFKNEDKFKSRLEKYLEEGKFYQRRKKESRNYFLNFDKLNSRDKLLNEALHLISKN